MAVLVAQVFNMTYQESLQWQEKEKAFLDTLDLMPLLIKGKDLRDLKYEIEDLYQIGSIGFIKAIQRFDTSFEVRLSTYAVPYILGEIKRFIRDDGPIKVSRSLKELNIQVNKLKDDYFNI